MGLILKNLKKSFKEFDLEKGGKKTGTYTNTSENRKKGRVGQKYSKDEGKPEAKDKSPKTPNNPIKMSDLKEGSKFKTKKGITFIIDKVEPAKGKNPIIIHSSYEGGVKGNYQDGVNDFLSFLNEEGSVKE